MGINTKDDVFAERFFKFGVVAGKTKGSPTCKICGDKIKKGTYVVGVHTFGEMPSYYHKACALVIVGALRGAINALADTQPANSADQKKCGTCDGSGLIPCPNGEAICKECFGR